MRYVYGVLMIAVLALSACAVEQTDTTQAQPPLPPLEDQVPDLNDAPLDTSQAADPSQDEGAYDVLLEVDGGMFWFEIDGERNPQITVSQGDVVRVVFTSVAGVHDFIIDELDAATRIVQEGETDVIEFVASERGEFEYYCGVGSHRERGMVGTFIVV